MEISSNKYVKWIYLDIVTNEVSFADTFSYVEPHEDFNAHEGVQPGFLDGELFPLAALDALDEAAQLSFDLRDLSGSGGSKFHFSVLQEHS